MIEPKENIRILHNFLVNKIEHIDDRGGSSQPPEMPSFELNARDFLDFAEAELTKSGTNALINCVSNLKRAIDCQVDTFLHVYNLRKTFERNGLGLDKRLAFLHEAGVFSSRTLSRIGDMRNKLEHEYKVPSLADAELYFDIASAFVAVLERTISAVWIGSHEFYMRDEGFQKIELVYERKEPMIKATVVTNGTTLQFQSKPTEPGYFAYLFRVYVLVTQYQSFVSRRRMIVLLREANVGWPGEGKNVRSRKPKV